MLTGNEKAMGIIETIKLITREEALEEGLEKGLERGREEGRKKEQYEFVKNLLLDTDFDITKIASLANVADSFVLQVKKDLDF
ncbi:hypothetical protein [Mucilaginibacter paludis]|nr:hypothetical protein [Mucilaginibacter paludis]